MNLPRLPIVFLFVLVGLFLWKEFRWGMLAPAESVLRDHLVLSHHAAGPPPTLVLQGGVDGAELSAMDVALFTRAASRLGARVAGVVAFQVPPSQLSASLPPGLSATDFFCGAMLVGQAAEVGPKLLEVPVLDGVSGWEFEQFEGSFSGFPEGEGWRTGFFQFPSTEEGGGKLAVIAERGGQTVASFSLAMFGTFAGWSGVQLSSDVLEVGRGVLRLDRKGWLPLDASAIRRLRRVDMDDLLLEAERLEQGRAPDLRILNDLEDRMVILGTLADGGARDIRLDSGRRLSMAEYQALAILSMQQALRPGFFPAAIDVIAILAFALLPLLFARFSSREGFALLLLIIGGWGFLVLSGIHFFFSALPILAPVILALLAWLTVLYSQSSRPRRTTTHVPRAS